MNLLAAQRVRCNYLLVHICLQIWLLLLRIIIGNSVKSIRNRSEWWIVSNGYCWVKQRFCWIVINQRMYWKKVQCEMVESFYFSPFDATAHHQFEWKIIRCLSLSEGIKNTMIEYFSRSINRNDPIDVLQSFFAFCALV